MSTIVEKKVREILVKAYGVSPTDETEKAFLDLFEQEYSLREARLLETLEKYKVSDEDIEACDGAWRQVYSIVNGMIDEALSELKGGKE